MVFSVLTKKKLVTITLLNSAGVNVAFPIDAVPSITHNMTSVITTNPIEDGSNITDHIILNPRTIELNCFISEAPLNFVDVVKNAVATTVSGTILPPLFQGSIVALLADSNDRVTDSYKILEELWSTKQKFSIQTGFKLYENMVIQSLTIPESIQRGLNFTMSLQQVSFAKTEYVKIPKSKVSSDTKHTATSKVNQGKTTLKPVVKEQASSLLYKLRFGVSL